MSIDRSTPALQRSLHPSAGKADRAGNAMTTETRPAASRLWARGAPIPARL
jgi:hypothetical protein